MTDRAADREHALKRLFWIYTAIICGVTVLALSVVGYENARGFGYPFNSLFCDPAIRFSDWTNFSVRVVHHGEPNMLSRRDVSTLPYPYPLASFYFYLAIVRMASNDVRLYLEVAASVFFLAGILFYVRTRQFVKWLSVAAATAATVILYFPVYFLLDRGNIEIFIWLLVMLGVVSFVKNWPWLAALFFAAAAACKIYPAIYLLLLVRRKQYKQALAGLLLAGAFSLFALWEIGPTIPSAFHETQKAAKYLSFTQIVPVGLLGLLWDHSLFGMWKMAHYHLLKLHNPEAASALRFRYSYVVFTLALPVTFLVIYIRRLRHLPLLNQVAALSLISILFPYVSYEYTLPHMLTVEAVFLLYLLGDVRQGRSRLSVSTIRNLMFAFALLCVPLSFGPLRAAPGLMKGVVLIFLLVSFLTYPMPSTLLGDLDPESLA